MTYTLYLQKTYQIKIFNIKKVIIPNELDSIRRLLNSIVINVIMDAIK